MNKSKSKVKRVKGYSVVRKKDFLIMDDATKDKSGKLLVNYPVFKDLKTARRYRIETYSRYWLDFSIVEVEISYTLPTKKK